MLGLKICIVGYPQKLMTKVVSKFTDGRFTPEYLPTLGVDITTKMIQVDNQLVKLILVDTAGQAFFGKLRPSYYRGASAGIICYEKTKNGLKEMTDWYSEFRNHIPDPSVPISILCFDTGANDLSTEEGQTLAKHFNAKYYEMTPQINAVVLEEIFRDLTRRALVAKG